MDWTFSKIFMDERAFIKLIVLKNNQKVIGLHYLGPAAAEVV